MRLTPAERHKRWRAHKQACGLCSRCGKVPALPGRTLCRDCSEYLYSKNMERYRKKKGIPLSFPPYAMLNGKMCGNMMLNDIAWVDSIVRIKEFIVGLDEEYFAEEGFCNDEFEHGCMGEIGVVVGFRPVIACDNVNDWHHNGEWWIIVDIMGLRIQCEVGDLEVMDPC